MVSKWKKRIKYGTTYYETDSLVNAMKNKNKVKTGKEIRIMISKFDYSMKPKNWQIVIARYDKTVPLKSKVGITKTQAMTMAKNYMKRN